MTRQYLAIFLSGLSVVLTAVSGILLSRHLGPATLGAYTAFFNVSIILSRIINFGGQSYLIKTIPQDNLSGNRTAADVRTAKVLGVSVLITSVVVLSMIVLQESNMVTLANTYGMSANEFYFLIGSAASISILSNTSAHWRASGHMLLGVTFDRILYQIVFVLVVLSGGLKILSWDPRFVMTILQVICAVLAVFCLFTPNAIQDGIRNQRTVSTPARISIGAMGELFAAVTLMTLNGYMLLPLLGFWLNSHDLGVVALLLLFRSALTFPGSLINAQLGPEIAIATAAGDINKVRMARMRNFNLAALAAVVMGFVIVVLYKFLMHAAGVGDPYAYLFLAVAILFDAILSAMADSKLYAAQFAVRQLNVNLTWGIIFLFRFFIVTGLLSFSPNLDTLAYALVLSSALSLGAAFLLDRQSETVGVGICSGGMRR